MDLADCFQCGMAYVALSRVKTLTGLKVKGLRQSTMVHAVDEEVKGFMQLYSVEQKRSQALEAHAAAFSVINNAGTQSTVISFAQKMYNNGVLNSKLHVIELGAQPGKPLLHPS